MNALLQVWQAVSAHMGTGEFAISHWFLGRKLEKLAFPMLTVQVPVTALETVLVLDTGPAAAVHNYRQIHGQPC